MDLCLSQNLGPFGSLAIEVDPWRTESLYSMNGAMPKELATETQKGLAMNFMNSKHGKDDVPNNKHPRVESGKQRSNNVDFEAPRQHSQNDKGKRELGQASSGTHSPFPLYSSSSLFIGVFIIFRLL